MATAKNKPAPPTIPDLIVHDVEPNTDEWRRVKCGVPSSSEFSSIMAQGDGRSRATYMRKLAGEIITGLPASSYSNDKMARGLAMEPEVLDWYARTRFVDVARSGFIVNPAVNFQWDTDHPVAAGWSPDALVGEDGAVEVKTHEPHILIPILERGTLPPEHRAQCHGGALLVGRRRWVDLVLYWPGMPKAVFRVEPDLTYHREIAVEIERFAFELKRMVARVREMEPRP